MRIWGLYSSRVDPYHAWELIELFVDEDQARLARDLLVGKPRDPGSPAWTHEVWRDDDDDPVFSDLHVIARSLR